MQDGNPDVSEVRGQELEAVKQSFVEWRSQRRVGARIPKRLWEAACSLHPRYSVAEIVRALRLDYTDLAKRIEGESARQTEAAAVVGSSTFVALPAMPAVGRAEATVRLREGRRIRIRIRLRGVAVSSVVELLRGVWSRG
jgi:hypothetical protein